MADIGFGITIVFQSGFCAEILSVDFGGMTRASVSTLHSETPEGWMTKMASRIKDAGSIDVELAFNPNTSPPINEAASAGEIRFPTPAGGSTPAKWAASMFMTNYKPTVPIDERMTAAVTLEISGKITITPST